MGADATSRTFLSPPEAVARGLSVRAEKKAMSCVRRRWTRSFPQARRRPSTAETYSMRFQALVKEEEAEGCILVLVVVSGPVL